MRKMYRVVRTCTSSESTAVISHVGCVGTADICGFTGFSAESLSVDISVIFPLVSLAALTNRENSVLCVIYVRDIKLVSKSTRRRRIM